MADEGSIAELVGDELRGAAVTLSCAFERAAHWDGRAAHWDGVDAGSADLGP